MANDVSTPNDDNGDAFEAPLDDNFIEQAEYISEAAFTALNADHPDEESIVRRLSVGGAKLLVGPRGCGKTTLMLKAYYGLLRESESNAFPVYVNFKLSLKLEPLYINTPNATYWFRLWLNLMIFKGVYDTINNTSRYTTPREFPSLNEIKLMISAIESGRVGNLSEKASSFGIDALSDMIHKLLSDNNLTRCVLLLDDAAHAFSARQQEDFFEFFRQIKSKEISPKAAIYPGITSHSPTFHVGHDAEQIDVWVRPNGNEYLSFMRSLARKRFNDELPRSLSTSTETLDFLAFASFGIPRSFLNMLRSIYLIETELKSRSGNVDRRKILDIAKQGRESSHNVYDTLAHKLPAYKHFVEGGSDFYQQILASIKDLNSKRSANNQALQVGIKRPLPSEIEKVVSFFQYAGLLMPAGENSRGEKGVFELYSVHYGDLVTENAIIGQRTKSISSFVGAFKAQTHQAWPRISLDSFASTERYASLFKLSLPHCQNCGAERASEHAKFCQNCGAQLKTSSLYDDLTNQPISALELSAKMVERIRAHSNIRRIKDILIDADRQNLRSIPQIGPKRAARIARYAEEYVA